MKVSPGECYTKFSCCYRWLFCLKILLYLERWENFMRVLLGLTCLLILTKFQVTDSSLNQVRSFLAWLRENSIHGKPDFWLMYVNRMIQWCGRIECLHFTYVLHDGLWRMSSTWASTKCAVSQVFFQISSKTSKNGLKLGIYFLRVLFWLCELEIGNSGCSDLR